jgi:hypothetical protein
MRIIIKPLGMIVIALVLGGSFFVISRLKSGTKGGLGFSTAALGGRTNLLSEARWKFYTEKGATGSMSAIQENLGGAVQTGLKVVTDRPGEQAWNVGVSNPLGVAFQAGQRLTLRFWGRSKEGSQLTIIMQRNIPGFPDCFKQTVTLTPEWKQYSYDVTTTTMAQWESMIAVHAGFQPGALELVGVELAHS